MTEVCENLNGDIRTVLSLLAAAGVVVVADYPPLHLLTIRPSNCALGYGRLRVATQDLFMSLDNLVVLIMSLHGAQRQASNLARAQLKQHTGMYEPAQEDKTPNCKRYVYPCRRLGGPKEAPKGQRIAKISGKLLSLSYSLLLHGGGP